jgi:hypothetical protein
MADDGFPSDVTLMLTAAIDLHRAHAIAEEMFRVAHEHRSTWSFLVELRPFGEVW